MQIRSTAVYFSGGIYQDALRLPNNTDKRALGQYSSATYARSLRNMLWLNGFGSHGKLPFFASPVSIAAFVDLLANHFAALFIKLVFN